MKKKEITREKFLDSIFKAVGNLSPDIPDYNRRFLLEGGRGLIQTLQKLFCSEFEKATTPEVFTLGTVKIPYQITEVFIAGVGCFKILYSKKYDMPTTREEELPLFQGLPEKCYEGEVFLEESGKYESKGFISTLMVAPYQNVDELIKSLKTTIYRTKEELDRYLEELKRLEI